MSHVIWPLGVEGGVGWGGDLERGRYQLKEGCMVGIDAAIIGIDAAIISV